MSTEPVTRDEYQELLDATQDLAVSLSDLSERLVEWVDSVAAVNPRVHVEPTRMSLSKVGTATQRLIDLRNSFRRPDLGSCSPQ